jgi:hypothetical protein
MPIINKALPRAASSSQGFARYIAIIWQVMVIFGGLAVLIWTIWGALDWIMAGSNPDRLKSAKEKMFNGIFGLVILALSFLIVKLISTVTGLDILNPNWPTLL